MSHRLSRRSFLGGSAALLASSGVAPLVAACGGGSSAKVTEIKALLVTSAGLYPKYWQQIVSNFKKATGITVNYDLLEFTPMTSKEVTLGAARSAQYDVYSTHTAQIGAFFNYFLPLNKHFSSSDLNDFFPVSVKYLTNPKTGELAAIPRNVDARVQFYRTDLYGDKGLKPATTWDELVSVSQALTGGGRYGLVVPGQGDPAQRTFSDFLWQAGGEWVDSKNKPAFNSAEGIAALTYYRDLIQKHKVVPPDAVSYQWDENSAEFQNGSVADTVNWPGSFAAFDDPSLSKVAGKWSTALYPKNKTAISCAVSHAMAVNRYSKKQDAAIEFVKYTVNADAQRLDYTNFKNFPSRQSIAKEVVAKAQGAEKLWLDQMNTTIANGKEWPKLPGFDKVDSIMYTAIEKALSNQTSPADSLNQAAKDALQAMQEAGAYR